MRAMDKVDDKLKHELADCLWSIMALANAYGIDIEKAFTHTMNELEERLTKT